MSATIVQGSFGLASWEGDTAGMSEPHLHDDVEINVCASPIRYVIRGQELLVPSNAFVLFWAAQPHQLLTVEPARMNWVTVPLRRMLTWQLPAPLLQRLLSREVITGPCTAATFDEESVRVWRSELEGDRIQRDTAERDIEVRLRRVLLSHEPGSRGETPPAGITASGSGTDAVATMARYITEHASRPLPVAEVAAAAHLHPNYAMALFKRVLGVTIGEYVASCRIHEAQRLLITSTTSIADIAHQSGYSSVSQFHDRFRQVVGMSPGAYRRARLPR
ncbi:helix-turn-helix domain-containing protein [Leifsonia sp. fls2-241-R2A-40a]|uniref:helix-turn-helix domain-containing protein n=1 Tax=Leifsonia sp. fls2-241-R2A-40a TaxID=3040290 RepID=UPI00254ECFB6|nr:helix-turn-helix domain-containing protein [Leifsonia sp. fls2-241-R2A-40a]